jgi:HEPN domain-containing protein
MAKSGHNSIHVRNFQRAAAHRLEEAVFLLESGGYTTAAVYLSGYAIECALKALLLSTVPMTRQLEVLHSFRGLRAHDFDWLVSELRRRRVNIPRTTVALLVSVSWWETDLRYSPRTIGLSDARDFLAVTQSVLMWVNNRL